MPGMGRWCSGLLDRAGVPRLCSSCCLLLQHTNNSGLNYSLTHLMPPVLVLIIQQSTTVCFLWFVWHRQQYISHPMTVGSTT